MLTISEVARRSGVASSALRFYEERGLIASERAGSGHRRYPRSVLRRIAFIVFAQKIGLTLEEIGAELAKLPPDRVPTRGDWARLSASWTKRIDSRIAELQRLRGSLTECIGCGCLSIDRCKLANPADGAARAGRGRATGWGEAPQANDGGRQAAVRLAEVERQDERAEHFQPASSEDRQRRLSRMRLIQPCSIACVGERRPDVAGDMKAPLAPVEAGAAEGAAAACATSRGRCRDRRRRRSRPA